jgi:hypothetical protein
VAGIPKSPIRKSFLPLRYVLDRRVLIDPAPFEVQKGNQTGDRRSIRPAPRPPTPTLHGSSAQRPRARIRFPTKATPFQGPNSILGPE